MNKIPNLDPYYKRATERLNRFFCEKVEDIREIEDMAWYLSTVLLWKELDNGMIAMLNDELNELKQDLRPQK